MDNIARTGTCIMYLTDSDTIKICWYWPDTDTDTRIGAALNYIKDLAACIKIHDLAMSEFLSS